MKFMMRQKPLVTVSNLLLLCCVWSSGTLVVVNAQLEELNYAAIRAWYQNCTKAEVPCSQIQETDSDPVFLDFDSCYSNPNMGQRSVSFLGRDANVQPVMYNLVFTSDEGMREFAPSNCDERGVCDCETPGTVLSDLRATILDNDAICTEEPGLFECFSTPFDKQATSCLVPASVIVGLTPETRQLACSLVADIALIPPDGATAAGAPSAPPANNDGPIFPTVDETSAPNGDATTPTPPPVDNDGPLFPTIDDTTQPNDNANSPTTAPDDTGTAQPADNGQANALTFPDATIPEEAHLAYCTAIVGWYDSCQDPNDDTKSWCAAANYEPLEDPVFVDVNTCYKNPILSQDEGRSVSFFTSMGGDRVMEYHIIVPETDNLGLIPTECNPDGTCVCPNALLDLKAQFLANGGDCTDTDDYTCLSENFYGANDDCFIPATFEFGSGGSDIYCSMVAKTEQYFPCDTMVEIPKAAYSTFCTAITGWYDSCSPLGSGVSDECDGATLTPLVEPFFIDLKHCYTNPITDTGVSFYARQTPTSEVLQFHLLPTETTASYYKAANCSDTTGVCDCTDTLLDLKAAFLLSGHCTSNDDYVCESSVFESLDFDADRCYVPAAVTTDTGTSCAMAASIESFFPCITDNGDAVPTDSDASPISPTVDEAFAPASATAPMAPPTDTVPTEREEPALTFSNVTIPLEANVAYCTAIVGWYDSCQDPNDDTTSWCAAANYQPLDAPVFVDFNTCYMNPILTQDEGRSVSFFGETTDGDRILEYHLIFKTASGKSSLLPTDCNPDGTCTCPNALLKLKGQFLANNGECSDADDYTCLSEDFYGATDECFVPATFKFDNGPSDVYCSMVAKMEQYLPCETMLDIPVEAYDTFCTAITGWYDKCMASGADGSVCDGADYTPLDYPVFFDMDHCYTNPFTGTGVSFFGRQNATGDILQFHLLPANTTGDKYAAENCSPKTGVCDCTSALRDLKAAFLDRGDCTSTDEYSCIGDYFGVLDSGPERCYVPATQMTDTDFTCAMVATIESFFPCDKNLLQQEPIDSDPDEPLVDPLSAIVPDGAAEAFCTAIVGWYNGCTETPDGGEMQVECNDPATSLATNPLFIDFDSCYVNPVFGESAVSMFGKDANGIVKAFHIIFVLDDNAAPYRPLPSCQDNGACECSDKLVALKDEWLVQGSCNITDDYFCSTEDIEGPIQDNCYIPAFAELLEQDSRLVCNMAAQLQQFLPCGGDQTVAAPAPTSVPVTPNLSEIPASAIELGYTAITGWWNNCGVTTDDSENECAAATNIRFEKPIYLNLDTCYSNPNALFRSVSLFLKDEDTVYSYHLLFDTAETYANYKPTDCSRTGECKCESNSNLATVRQSLQDDPTNCQNGDGYSCTREEFSAFNNDCYVPAQQRSATGEAVCAMAASLKQIVPTADFGGNEPEDPGEAEYPKPDEGGSVTPLASTAPGGALNAWAIVLIVVAVLLFVSVLFVVHRRRRQRTGGSTHGSDHGQDVWIRPQADSRFTRRPLNTDDAGDGVWKKENIHDLKFTVD